MDALKAGDDVFCFDGGATLTKVVDLIYSGEQEVYEIEFEDGSFVKATMSHKFVCVDGYTRTLKDILQNDIEIETIA